MHRNQLELQGSPSIHHSGARRNAPATTNPK
jgi:hypothetical protein